MEITAKRDLSRLTSDDIAPLERALPEHFNDSWRDFARSLYLTLFHLPDPLPPRATLATELVLGIARDLGGSQPYMAAGHFVAAAERAAAVKREFRGNNHHQLAVKYGVSDSRIRQILAGK